MTSSGFGLLPWKTELTIESSLGEKMGWRQGEKECHENDWVFASSLETLGQKVPCT